MKKASNEDSSSNRPTCQKTNCHMIGQILAFTVHEALKCFGKMHRGQMVGGHFRELYLLKFPIIVNIRPDFTASRRKRLFLLFIECSSVGCNFRLLDDAEWRICSWNERSSTASSVSVGQLSMSDWHFSYDIENVWFESLAMSSKLWCLRRSAHCSISVEVWLWYKSSITSL